MRIAIGSIALLIDIAILGLAVSERQSLDSDLLSAAVLCMSPKPSNGAFERAREHRGRAVLALDCVLCGAQSRCWPTAQLGP